MDGFDEKLKAMKQKRKEDKKEATKAGKRPELIQASSSISSADGIALGRQGSISSSDIEDLVAEAREREKKSEGAQGNDNVEK